MQVKKDSISDLNDKSPNIIYLFEDFSFVFDIFFKESNIYSSTYMDPKKCEDVLLNVSNILSLITSERTTFSEYISQKLDKYSDEVIL